MKRKTFICKICGSEFPMEEMVIDESEGEVCKGCYEDMDKCEGGHVFRGKKEIDA